jgi:CheY-like chemotaxis protein
MTISTGPTPPPSVREPRKLGILLVEDHADTAVVLARLLRKMGHHVVPANSVVAALKAAETQFKDTPLDLLISDMGLPDGSGRDIMRALLAKGPVKGIALSGFGMESDILESHAAGFSRHLVKPISVDALRKTILELM